MGQSASSLFVSYSASMNSTNAIVTPEASALLGTISNFNHPISTRDSTILLRSTLKVHVVEGLQSYAIGKLSDLEVCQALGDSLTTASEAGAASRDPSHHIRDLVPTASPQYALRDHITAGLTFYAVGNLSDLEVWQVLLDSLIATSPALVERLAFQMSILLRNWGQPSH